MTRPQHTTTPDHADAAALRELAEDLIRVDTTSPVTDPEIFEHIQAVLAADGIDSTIHEVDGAYNLTATTGESGTHICLNGHVDVVEAGSGWTVTEPFDPVVADGKLYGRGATDMKGGVAAQVQAFRALHRDDAFEGRATLMVVGDEEIGGDRGTGVLVDRLPRFDYAIVGEPTDMDIQVGTRGALWVDVRLRGESVHASRPHLADNISHHLPALIDRLRSFTPSFDPVRGMPDPTCAVTVVETDDTQNSLPDSLRVGLDIRYLPTQDADGIVAELRDHLAPVDAEFTVEYTDHGGAFTLEDDRFRDTATEVLTAVRGEAPRQITEGGASDGRFFAERGTPFIELGTTQDSVHTADEYCRLDTLPKLQTAYYRMAKQLAADC